MHLNSNATSSSGRAGLDSAGAPRKPERVLFARITREDDKRCASCLQFQSNGLGRLVAKIHIQHGHIATLLSYQPQGFGHRNGRAHDLKASVCQLLSDIQSKQGVILDHKHSF